MAKLSLALGFGVGYVLGARAGRGRYEEIKRAATGFVQRPDVQEALGRARDSAPSAVQQGIDTLTGNASGGRTPDAPPADAGGPRHADGPLPDPLIPPSRSR